jgi:uncharacterized membrane protein
MGRAGRIGTAAGLGIILACLSAALLAGLAEKQPCASGSWGDLRQYRQLCYSDIVPLYGSEALQGNRLPYLDHCDGVCDEYPVVTMYAMRLAAYPVNSYPGFFYSNVFLLSIAAFVTAFALYRMVGMRALYFALAPTLIVYGFMNWDLIAVAFAAVGTLAFVRRRDATSGIMLGLGAAAKLFPAFLLVPFAAERLRQRERMRALSLVWWAVWGWLVVNGPFMTLAFHRWSTFFTFNKGRGADFDSLWFIACDHLHGRACLSTKWVNNWSVFAFVVLSALVWAVRVRRDPDMPRWQLGFPILVAFLLTNKVYSPQYGVWLLPWFALALPDIRLFVAFELSDVAVFVTRFAWFGHLGVQTAIANGQPPPPAGWTNAISTGWFQLAVLVRAAVLIACLVSFALRSRSPTTVPALPEGAPGGSTPEAVPEPV